MVQCNHGISLLIKLSLHHKQDDWAKRPLSRQFTMTLKKKSHANFFQGYPHAIHFNFVHLWPSMLFFPFAVFLLCSSTVLSGYCNVSFYFLGILGVMKLHHWWLSWLCIRLPCGRLWVRLRPDQYSGSSNNQGESAAFVITLWQMVRLSSLLE